MDLICTSDKEVMIFKSYVFKYSKVTIKSNCASGGDNA